MIAQADVTRGINEVITHEYTCKYTLGTTNICYYKILYDQSIKLRFFWKNKKKEKF